MLFVGIAQMYRGVNVEEFTCVTPYW